MPLALSSCRPCAAVPASGQKASRRPAAATTALAARRPSRSFGSTSCPVSSHSPCSRVVICAASSQPGPAASQPSPQQCLVEAAFQGDVAEVAALLGSAPVDVNGAAEAAGGPAAGEAASWWCNLDVAWALKPRLQGSYGINRERFEETSGPPSSEATPLAAAAAAGRTAVVALLLQHSADLSNPTWSCLSQGQDALFAAAVAGHTDVMRLLLDAGVSPNARAPKRAWVPPKALFPEAWVQPEAERPDWGTDEWGHTVLMLASAAGRRDVCQLLIERGARVNARTHGRETEGNTALMVAAAEGHAEVVRLLLAHGANPNSRYWRWWSEDSRTLSSSALHLAAWRGSLECVRLLCDAGADVNAYTEEGRTPLMCAAEAGSLPVVQLLVERGARMDPPIPGCYSALIVAAFFPDIEAFLLSHGAKSGIHHMLEHRIASTESLMLPDSQLPADPEQRQGETEYNSLLQAAIADYRSKQEAEERRCAELLNKYAAGSNGSGPGSGGEPSSGGF